ncbi:MAG: SEC-C domain-containing protein [Ilumatobacteraceae bacterium]
MARATDNSLRDTVIATLGDGAVSLAELRSRLKAPWDRPAGRDDLDRLLQLDTAFAEVTDGFVFVPALVEGTAWTVRVDADDAAEGFVRMHPALSALGWWLINDDVELVGADGERLGVLETDGWMLDDRDTDVVLGPEGWLDGLAGGWARVDVVGGALRWSPLDGPPAATLAQVRAMRVGFERAVRDDDIHRAFDAVPMPDGLRFSSGESPIHEALLADPAAFRRDPIPPLGDLYAAAGLDQRNGLIAAEGFDWDALHAWQTRNRLGISHGLDTAQVDLLTQFLTAVDTSTADGVPAEVLAALDDGDVAAAAWEELGRRSTPMERLAELAGAASSAERSIGQAWWQARVLDRAGESAAAAELLEAAVDPTCRHVPVLVDLAGLRADRGDAPGALRLLVQAGVEPVGDDDELDEDELDDGELLWDEVEGFASRRPRPTARRNDPCPCGSSRKYKACHLGRETHSLEDRAGWLYLKASRFLRVRRPLATEDLAGLAVDEIGQPNWFEVLADGPFLRDVVLHEDGVFGEFLAARDGLLPDDEALLAAQWALVDRGVFEVLDTTGAELHLRDVARGDRIRVVNVHPSDIRVGMLLVGRPLPVGETYRAFSGFMPLPHGHQDAMLAAIDRGDSEEIADAIAAVLAPPRLSNTDGQDLIAHTITWRVPQPDAVGTALIGAGLKAEGDDHWTLVRDSKNQDNTVIAGLRLVGDELTVEVNSSERAAELQLLVADALPDAEVIDVDVHPFEMPDEPIRTSGTRTADLDDPAIRAALAEHIAGYERRWLDESIPALGGRTPREAAGDPIGREELTRLLASFPVPGPDEVGAMDPDRLRAELGL